MSATLTALHEQIEEPRPWLRHLRRAAFERFAALGFPTTHNEDWKYTNVTPFTKIPFERSRRPAPRLLAPPKGATVTSLAHALETEPGLLEEHLARYAGFHNNAFVALNTAFMSDGVLIRIPNGAVIEEPIHLVFTSSEQDRPTVSYPRTLILAGRDSQAAVIEEYRGADGSLYFTNAVTELVAGEGAVIAHYKLEKEGDRALHFGALAVRQARSSIFTSHSIALGGALVRNELNVVLDGEGAECTLNGLYVAGGQQHIDNYTTLDHAQPRTTSYELYKGILDGSAQGVFHGRIIVRPDAQKTDAIQRNKNLLLSEKAVINTKPQLEIYANDVRCTHGATVGQVDPEALFYLRSRGIGHQDARNLLTYAFASEMIERMKFEPLRSRLEEVLHERC